MGFGTDIVVDLPNKTRADMTWDYLAVWRAAGRAGSGNPEMHDHERRGAASDQQAARSNCRPGLAADIVAAPAIRG